LVLPKKRIAKLGIALATVILLHSIIGAQEGASRTVWDGVYSEEQARRGKEKYAQICSKCHASDLSGMDEAPALTGGAFLANWSGLSIGDLSERVRISMPPNNKGKLTRQEIADVLSHVLSVNGFPSGKAELDPRNEVQRQIRIEAAKPKTN